MTFVLERDTGLWLHNKLGTTDQLIATLHWDAIVHNHSTTFLSALKFNLLLEMLHLPHRRVDKMKVL
jgi:hypothetical protein